MTLRFSVLLPVKLPRAGKSRLLLEDETLRPRLAHAFVLDVIEVLQRSSYVETVQVVCADTSVDFGVPVVQDLGEGSLNRALSLAAARLPDDVVRVALLPDLPALRLEDLDDALARCGAGRSFVADHQGTGTTLLAAFGESLDPRFGVGSAQRHRAGGARSIGGDLPSLRLDVDTAADLARARLLGVGNNTAAVFARGQTPPQ